MSLPFHSMIKLCNTASQLFVFSHFVGGGGGRVLCRWSWSRLCLLTYLLNKQHKTTTTTSVVSFCITAICVCLLSLQYHWVTWLFFFNVPIYSSLLISLKKLWVNIFFSLNEMGKTGAKIISKKLTKGSSVIFRSFFKSVFPKNLLGLPPPPLPLTFVQKKKFDGHPNVYVYQYVLEHPYKLHAGPLVDSTPLHHYHQPDDSSLRYVHRALSPRTPAMLFRNWWSTTTVFLSGTTSMTVMHSGRRPHFARVHTDLRHCARVLFAGGSLGAWRTSVSRHNMNARTFRTGGWRQS